MYASVQELLQSKRKANSVADMPTADFKLKIGEDELSIKVRKPTVLEWETGIKRSMDNKNGDEYLLEKCLVTPALVPQTGMDEQTPVAILRAVFDDSTVGAIVGAMIEEFELDKVSLVEKGL